MLTRVVILCVAVLSVRAVDLWDVIQDDSILEKCMPSMTMLDASAKIPSGILSGNLNDMGNFEQCLEIDEKNNSIITQGQYCIVKLSLPADAFTRIGSSNFLEKPKLENLEGGMIVKAIKTITLNLGWCLPHTCPIGELATAFNKVLTKIDPNLNVSPFVGCQTKEDLISNLNTSNIIFITFLASTLFLIIISTLYDTYLHYSQKQPAHIILVAFSAKTNTKKLLSVSNNSSQLGCLHGIRFLSMMWVVLGHRYIASFTELINNPKQMGEWMLDANNMYIINALLSVDSFFVLAGLLVGYTFCLAKEKGIKFNIILYYVHRYLRLTPVFAVVIWFHATLFDSISSGPIVSLITPMKNHCINHWWTSMLYIQNYYKPKEMCVGQSWYLAIDMQLFILSPIILIPLWRWPKQTMIGSFILVLGSIAGAFAVTYVNDLGVFLVDSGGESQNVHYNDYYYFPTHIRFGPWLMGLMLGYYLFTLKGNKHNKIRMHPVEVTFGWIVGMALLLSTLYSSHELIINRSKLGNSFYNALHRHGWSLGLCWVIYACTQGYGGPVNAFLSWPFFQILARFTYTVYLVHYPLQFIILFSLKTTTHFSDFQTMYDFWGDLMFSFGIAYCLIIAYESPMITIEKVLFKTGKKPKKAELPIQNTTLSNRDQTNKV